MGARLHLKHQWFAITDDRFISHTAILENPVIQCEIEADSVPGIVPLETTAFISVSGSTAVAGVLSSFGYRWAGTSLRNVAPSHPARRIDEPLTKRLVFIN